MLHAVATFVFIILVLGGIASGLFSIVSYFQAIANRKEGMPPSHRPFFSPVTLIAQPALFTERGLAARRRWIFGVFSGSVFWLAAVLFGIVSGIAAIK